MADVAWQDVVDQAPELANPKVALAAQTLLLAWANTTLKVSIWGGEESPKLKLARVYLIAHVATLQSKGGVMTAGPVISQSEGGVSQSYANLMTSTSFGVSGTPYATLYNFLLSTTTAGLPIIAGMSGLPFGWGF